ncbi:MAG: hypothetical protein EBU81_14620, partial [Proteobacteria bacterium]|nr:hypothetical protein [Pseudomonadota bacterium]
MTKIVGPEGPQPKRPGKSKPAPEEAPAARPKADGEKVVLSEEARESNRTGAILKLLAGTIEAKEAAQAAKAEVARRSAIESDRAKAAKIFNDAAREARGALSVAESDGTTLVDRKAAAEKVAGLLKKAGEGLPGLDPSAEGAAGDVLDRLQARLDGLNARIVREDKAVEEAKGRIETDRKALDDALGHSKDEKKLGRTLRDLA